MNNEFFDALELIAREKGISIDYLIEKITNAITIAVKKDFGGVEAVNVVLDPLTRQYKVSIIKDVVREVEDPVNQITLEEAQRYSKRAMIGEPVEIKLETKQFGRIAAQTAKHVIRQGIREAEREQMMNQMGGKVGEVVTATVNKIDPANGNAFVQMDKNEVLLFKNEQLPTDDLQPGDKIKVYVVDVTSSEKRCSLKISRTHKDLVKRLFEMEVPEIFDGTVQVKSISREAGSRTKIAVYSKDENVDPIGACIGPKGMRVSNIIEELGGEKIDVIQYSEDPAQFIAAALSPADVTEVILSDDGEKIAFVSVPDSQLSLAIGNKGQNAKLAARLTGYKIDISPDSAFTPVAPAKPQKEEEETVDSETDELMEEQQETTEEIQQGVEQELE
ncbi:MULTISPECIES: transcription termination factor NusA [Clostridiaceae]|uniref:Transcription termination/antitermination protein NusA n=1 Tax=Clostridium facile TaxID=2763035 RepID=A0ABR7IRW0_9CLOT|nr:MULTISPECIES: transcription termination factor NusA [Clostridiaceae]MBC5787875.1 transcription termination/antitermination protein NusA [Clostridium facile]